MCNSCHAREWTAVYRKEMEEIICQPCYEKELQEENKTKLIEVTQEEWKQIPKDYKGIVSQWMINNSDFATQEQLGKRQVFAGCIKRDGGTTLLTEGIDFKII
jgi:hypothetical protein